MRLARNVLLWIGLTAGIAASPALASPIAWVEMTARGPEARLITDASSCPNSWVDGRRTEAAERAGPDADFPNRVCATSLKRTDHGVHIAGASLKSPRARVNRIVILGDSGCRLKGQAFQHCNDPSGWPFARIAALAATKHPDLVIHLGDYYYREKPCPPGNAGCAGSPYGDKWATWKAEVFDPAAPLLAAAPWVFVRGNHEDCKRGGAGWFRLLDAGETVAKCPSDSPTFAVDLGDLRLWVVDSNDTEDLTAPPEKVAAFSARLEAVTRAPGGERNWIVTHRPIWDSARLANFVSDGLVNATERAAVKARGLEGVDLIIAGHVHNFSALNFGAARPAQWVVGTGGDTLDLDSTPPPTTGQAEVDGLKADIFTMGRFGFLLLDRRGAGWTGRFFDTENRVAAICALQARSLTCRAPRVR